MPENQWEELNRRQYDRQLMQLDKKLDDHAEKLENMRQTLSTIAVQSVQISSLQSMQNELRGDINEIYAKIEKLMTFQTTCPRKQMSALWGVVVSVALSLTGSFVLHIFGGK
jgi:hypothetical protein